MGTQKHNSIWGVGLALALLCLASTAVFADRTNDGPVSRGVVATITALDATTGMATLQTAEGEVFALPKRWHWQVGDTVECDRIDSGPRLARLQHCQPWPVPKAAGGASAPQAAGAADAVRFLAKPSSQ